MKMEISISNGNKKLISTKKEKFLIFSLPCQLTCPYATNECKKICYAKKSERLYKNTRISRRKNYFISLTDEFIDLMTQKINAYKRLYTRNKIYFRIHESGDFYSYSYFMKWIEIVNKFEDITFLAYTKSLPFVEQYLKQGNILPSNLIIRYSIMKDTHKKEINKAKKYKLSTFEVVNDEEYNNYDNLSKCQGSCENCKKCYSNSIKNIVIKKH